MTQKGVDYSLRWVYFPALPIGTKITTEHTMKKNSMAEFEAEDRNLTTKRLTQGSVPMQLLGSVNWFERICKVMEKLLGRKYEPIDLD